LNLHNTHPYFSLDEYQGDSIATLAALGAAAKKVSEQPGTRILVFISSGFIIHIGRGGEHDVESDVQKFVDAAVHWNVAVDGIDGKGLSTELTAPQPGG
jgi:hypothetical protein